VQLQCGQLPHPIVDFSALLPVINKIEHNTNNTHNSNGYQPNSNKQSYIITTITMCSQPNSTASTSVTKTEEPLAKTTPPQPISRKSCIAHSPQSVLFDGTSATFSCSSSSLESESAAFLTTSSQTSRKQKKSVTFDSIQFQEHSLILGDNPGVQSGGPPVTMDWSVVRKYQMDLEEYETAVGSRRSVGELRMPATIRQGLLEGCCNMAEMKRAAAAARKIRNQRQFTMAMAESASIIEHLEVFCASVKRKVQRTVSGSRRKSRSASLSTVSTNDTNNQNVSNKQQQQQDKQQQSVDLAECWIQQQMPRTSRRATFPTYLVSRNTHRNSLRSAYGYGYKSDKTDDDLNNSKQTQLTTTTETIEDDIEEDASLGTQDEDAILVAAAMAQMTVTE
jgi:hypothetical protein